MASTLSGKVALITGAGRGIGRAIALALGGAGATIALAARTRSQLDAVAAELGSAGGM
jgi:NAD(P)-dependent dehydrogenase (short-subunit alcohol dehydrogenase family)